MKLVQNIATTTAVTAAMIVAVSPAAFACQPKDNSKHDVTTASHKVTICHATNSDNNPYVMITVDTDAAHGGKDHGKGDHAAEHDGTVWTAALKAQHISWGDIIPAYTDDQGVSFPGLNWTAAGQAIFNNGCKVPQAQPTPTPTPTSAPTPTPTPTTPVTPTPTTPGTVTAVTVASTTPVAATSVKTATPTPTVAKVLPNTSGAAKHGFNWWNAVVAFTVAASVLYFGKFVAPVLRKRA